jgi:hypothetical protein
MPEHERAVQIEQNIVEGTDECHWSHTRSKLLPNVRSEATAEASTVGWAGTMYRAPQTSLQCLP